LREALAAILREDGHTVLACADIPEDPGVQDIDADAMILDFDLLRERGLAFARHFHRVHPTTSIVVVGGTPTTIDAQRSLHPFLRFHTKPFFYEELHRHLHERPPAWIENSERLHLRLPPSVETDGAAGNRTAL